VAVAVVVEIFVFVVGSKTVEYAVDTAVVVVVDIVPEIVVKVEAAVVV